MMFIGRALLVAIFACSVLSPPVMAQNVTPPPSPCSVLGTASGQCAQGGVIAASGPTGGATTVPVITYNAAGQITAFTTAPTGVTAVGTAAVGAIPGSTGNTAAAAGNIGELITGSASGVSISTTTALTITSASVTAGDWDVSCTFVFAGGATTTVTRVLGSISTTNNTLNSTIGFRQDLPLGGSTAYLTSFPSVNVGPVQALLSGSTTYYCVAQSEFGTSTTTVSAVLFARRRH